MPCYLSYLSKFMTSMDKVVDTCLNHLECLLGWDMIDLLASTFKVLNWLLMWPGIRTDPSSTSKESEQSHTRRVTQSDPCGVEPR